MKRVELPLPAPLFGLLLGAAAAAAFLACGDANDGAPSPSPPDAAGPSCESTRTCAEGSVDSPVALPETSTDARTDAPRDATDEDSMRAPVVVGCIPQEVGTRYDAKWHFGFGCEATWSTTGQLTLTAATVSNEGSEGTAAAADPKTGALVAWSDGINLFDGARTKKNTAPLGGAYGASQAVAFVGAPGSTSAFYVVTNKSDIEQIGGGLYVTPIGCGDLQPSAAPTLIAGTEGVTEALATVRHANDVDRWVLSAAPTGVVVIKVTSAGIGAPAITPWGAALSGVVEHQRAFIAFARDRRTFAITAEGLGLVVGTFDNATGAVAGLRAISVPSTAKLYSAAFSPNKTKLYASEWSGSFWQIDLSAGDAVTALGASGGALRLAIDDKIYLSSYDAPLTVITNPNAAPPALAIGSLPLPTGCMATYGLPGVNDL
ncbi:MAG: hypothetical protein JST00_12325 [Deltaproteobacteria bacterium]|nr:hypothetical protein [Deltaproteobacteria bacterium]